MERNFPRSMTEVLKWEGGYTNNPRDPGGPTNLGVTLANFRAYVKPNGTVDDLKVLTKEQAAVVFRRHYWDVCMCSSLPDGVDFAVFDYAVNSGPERAARALQGVVVVGQDGTIATKTLEAADHMAPAVIIANLCSKRLNFLRALPTFPTFGRGWTTRVNGVQAVAMQMAAQSPEAPAKIVIDNSPRPTVIEKPVPVVAEGSDKRSWLWTGMSSISISTVVSAFIDVPWQVKVGAGILAIATVIAMLFLGDRIIRRVKRLRDEVNAS